MRERILFAGHEIGGQMQLLAETLRKKGFDAQAAAFNDDFRKYKNDFNIPTQKIPVQRFRFFLKALQQYDIFHFFWGVSLFDFWRFSGLDLPLLHALNKKIIVHFRGTDIVNIEYYNFLNAKAQGKLIEEPPRSRIEQVRKLKKWEKYAHRILVSTPDLLEIVKGALLVPQIVDTRTYSAVNLPPLSPVFRFAHAPTRRNTKGTDYIIEAVSNLQLKSVPVELDLIENEPPDEVIRRFAQCDAGIDQILYGWYGKVSIELMALGKPSVCYIDDKFKHVWPDLSIINANRDNLEQKLIEVISEKENYRRSSEHFRSFVQAHHSADAVSDQLIQLYSRIES